MSERNTIVLIPGHQAPGEILEMLRALPEVDESALSGEETPRVGTGSWEGRDYTVLCWRLFELGGLAALEKTAFDDNEVEALLGLALSARWDDCVFALYDEETAYGGFAHYRNGGLAERIAVDGRWGEPVRRVGTREEMMEGVDPSGWVWPELSQTVMRGTAIVLGKGLPDDDAIEACLKAADPQPVAGGPPPQPKPQESLPPRQRKRDRLMRGLKGLLKR